MTFDEVMAAAKERAHKRCRACRGIAYYKRCGQPDRKPNVGHTCRKDLATIRSVAEAAVNEVSVPAPRVLIMIRKHFPLESK